MGIEIRDVHKAFGSKEVLRGFSAEAHDGETLVILGGSGSGKSVTLKHIVGLLAPDRGEVWVDGLRVDELDREGLFELRRNVGYVFQFAALFDSMTVAENVGMGLKRLTGVSKEDRMRRVEECLERVDMVGYGERLPAELSGGQKKRVGIARAIATEPRYILYDEPTTGLDPMTRAVIDQLINRMKAELGVTGIVITHDMESAFRVADRFAMIHDGKQQFQGSPDEIRSSADPMVRAFIEGRPELIEEAE
ncbi:MAG: ABC transporter ATP-binding protein [Gemmatimonadales bacterium]|nr:MAG: ABC transporter ATP-binding protein [Gemmatimonadales bacterium]